MGLPLLLAATALVGTPAPVPTVAGVPADGLWRALAASPRLLCSNGTGTAVVVGRSPKGDELYVLTAEHVVRKATELRLEFYERDGYPKVAKELSFGLLIEGYKLSDLALLRFPVDPRQAYPEAKLAGLGERPRRFPVAAFTVGCNVDKPPTVEAVTVVGKRSVVNRGEKGANLEEVAFFWETAQAPVPGRSGGPLFDTAGRVIGICAATKDGKGYYAHLDEIQAVLKQKRLATLFEDDRKNR